jgi:hypothetical protein
MDSIRAASDVLSKQGAAPSVSVNPAARMQSANLQAKAAALLPAQYDDLCTERQGLSLL